MTRFPAILDLFNNPTAVTPMNAPGYEHDLQHANANDAIKALQAKVGVDNSAVVTSLDYRLRQLEQGGYSMPTTLNLAPAANTGAVRVSGYSLTGDNTQAMFDLAGTWNTSGRPAAVKLNITDAASDLFSALMDLQINGSTVFKVDKRSVVFATYYENTQGQPLLSGSAGNLYLFYPASGYNAIVADDPAQALSFLEAGSGQVRAQVTAYADFVFFDSVNGNQPCFVVRGDGSAISTNGGSVVFGASGNTFWNAGNEETIGLQVNSAAACAIELNTGDGITWGVLGVRTSSNPGLFLSARYNGSIHFELDYGSGYVDAHGNFFVSGSILDSSGNLGNVGDVLTATATGTVWQATPPPIRSLFDKFGGGSSGVTETSLLEYDLPGGTLANEGEKFIGEYTGTFANSTSQKRLKFYFGLALIFDTGALSVSAASTWTVSVIVMSVPTFQTVVCLVKATVTGTTPGVYAANIIFPTNLGSDQNLKLTGTASGTGAADNDIQALFGTGRWQTGQFSS